MMEKKYYGTLKDGREVSVYHIEKGRLSADIMDFGAVLINLVFDGVDVNLGYRDLDTYLENPGNLGAVIGPNANRIADARFELDGQVYPLEVNNGVNNLHSSIDHGAHKKLWEVTEYKENSLALQVHLAELECGFPGEREFTVCYTIEDDALKIRYGMLSDRKTVFNPTNHAYFNLNGHNSHNAYHHSLKLFCSAYTPDREGSIPTGEIAPVAGTPMDFREESVISEMLDMSFDQLALTNGYDHNFAVDHYDGTLRPVAVLKGDKSGITMETWSDLPGVQFYGSNFLGNDHGKDNTVYHAGDAICLETQYFPNSINQEGFLKPVIEKDKWAESTTEYRFKR